MPLVLKICGSDWTSASRDRRELSAYRELGYDVLVMAKGEPGDRGRPDEVSGFPVLRYSTRPLGARVPNPVNRFVSLFQWAHNARQLHPNVISGHDLLPGLLIAWMSTLLQRKKPQLIYDSHEFELGRYAKRTAFQKTCIRYLEAFLMRRCAFSIMVNDSIADEVQRIHKLKDRPVVVRSTPDRWTLDPQKLAATRAELLAQFRSRDVRMLLMFHGNHGFGSGLEYLIDALARFPDLGLVLLGKKTDAKYYADLVEQAARLGVSDRVLALDAAPFAELRNYVGAVDLEMMVGKPPVKSYYFALPNKMFEAIQGETPIITSDRPEMSRIVREYGVGLICEPGNVDDLCRCIEKMRTDKAFYAQCKENLLRAKDELCWEREKNVLKDAFVRCIGKPEN